MFRGVGASTVSHCPFLTPSSISLLPKPLLILNSVNLPIGAVTFLTLFLFYHPKHDNARKLALGWKAKLDQFDLPGLTVFLAMIICLLLALQWGGNTYAWSDRRIIALLVVFGVLTLVFVAIQIWRQDNGTMPPRIMKQRTVGASFWFAIFIGASFFSVLYL